jgi:hypothetical protein
MRSPPRRGPRVRNQCPVAATRPRITCENPLFVDMVAVQTSSTIQRGTDWDFSFSLQEDGPCSQYADLTDWFVAVTLKTATGVALTTPSIVRPTPETVAVRLTNTQTALFSAQFGALLTINVQRPDGWDIRLIEARVTIS